MTAKTEKAAIYIRVSTDAQREEGYSIDAQKEQLTGLCQMKAIKNYEYYIDGGYTGSNILRPELQRLINDIESGKISHVFVYKLDRLSRSQKDTLLLIEDVFNPNGITFVSLTENLDTSTPTGRLMIGILSAFAQLERENIRERTRMGMLERVKAGYWPGGGQIPFGYDYDAASGILIPNKDAETVQKMFALYLQGYSTNKIAKTLGFKYENQVSQILRRKSSCGLIVYKEQEYEGRHEAIISLETFNEAQEMHKARAKHTMQSQSKYLLTGRIYCGKCGAKMRYQKWGPTAGCKLVCYSRMKGREYLVKDPNCEQASIWAEDVENAVTNALFSFRYDYDVRPENELVEVSILQSLEMQKKKLERTIKNLFSIFAAEGDPLVYETIHENKAMLADLNAQIELELETGINAKRAKQIVADVKDIESSWPDMTAQERKNIVGQLIDKVTITGNHIEIDFLF